MVVGAVVVGCAVVVAFSVVVGCAVVVAFSVVVGCAVVVSCVFFGPVVVSVVASEVVVEGVIFTVVS